MRSLPTRGALVALLACMLSLSLHAQSFEQTLPSGYMNNPGGSSTINPFASTSDSVWQWHYPASNFAANGPIMINEIYVRLDSPTLAAPNFSYTSMQITLIEASTPVGGRSTIFANNIQRGVVCRTGPFANFSQTLPTNGVVGCWIPLRLDKGFLYDPTSGNGFIVQINICGVNVSLGAIDGEVGNSTRAGRLGDCLATVSTINSPNFVPITKIDYTPVLEQTLPSGQLGANSNTSSSFPVNTLNDQVWQWHYDNSEFAATGPITISEVSVRANNNNTAVQAFDFGSYEVTLIEASTDYRLANHDLTFANNVFRSKVVRAGQWTAPQTAASGGGSSTWISFQLTDTFDFDPTTGRDFIVQIRSCGAVTSWGTAIDASSGSAGTNGGNRYGVTTDCTSTASTFSNNELVPVVKISYSERDIATFPYKENFDNWGPRFSGDTRVPPGWNSDFTGNILNWRFYNRSNSTGTTPSDHTTGKTGLGYYLSTEDSSNESPSELIESPIFDLSTMANPSATFWAYSFSPLPASSLDENILRVEVRRFNPNGTTSTFFNRISAGAIRVIRSGCWTKYSVDLAGLEDDRVSFLFRGSADSSSGFLHDFAIDDFCIQNRLPDGLGQPATSQARLLINDSWNNNGDHSNQAGAAGPFVACGRPSLDLNITISGPVAFQPVALWIGPLNVGVANFGPNGQMDTGTPDTNGDVVPENLFSIGDGTAMPPSLLDLFFFTNAVGVMDIKLQLNPALPPGVLGAFQAVVGNGPSGIFLTNAVVLEIVP